MSRTSIIDERKWFKEAFNAVWYYAGSKPEIIHAYLLPPSKWPPKIAGSDPRQYSFADAVYDPKMKILWMKNSRSSQKNLSHDLVFHELLHACDQKWDPRRSFAVLAEGLIQLAAEDLSKTFKFDPHADAFLHKKTVTFLEYFCRRIIKQPVRRVVRSYLRASSKEQWWSEVIKEFNPGLWGTIVGKSKESDKVWDVWGQFINYTPANIPAVKKFFNGFVNANKKSPPRRNSPSLPKTPGAHSFLG